MKIQEKVELAKYTNIGLGGTADYLVEVSSVDELCEALKFANEKNLPAQVISGGSNVIFSDEGFSGLIIVVKILGIEWSEDGEVRVQSGENWDEFVQAAISRNWAGVENMSGIPGSVGATPIQNVGAYGQEVGSLIIDVEVLNRQTLELIRLTGEDCQFGYRTSRFKQQDQGKYVVTAVSFKLVPNGRVCLKYPQLEAELNEGATLREARTRVLDLRRAKSMVVDVNDPNSKSCGSFFVNPVKTNYISSDEIKLPTFIDSESGEERIPAAWLIEQIGFSKGFKQNGVGISENHNLALVNIDGTTQSLLELASEIEDRVFEKFGIKLEREPVVVE